jgi:uncharacterized protein with NAD-binding domain and iron-sulfur cluster
MKRREFSKSIALLGLGTQAGLAGSLGKTSEIQEGFYQEPAKKLPVRKFDVVVAGGGTAGLFAAMAAARQGAKTMLVETKGYCGGVAVEGGTAIHSFYNLYTAFENCKKRKVVQGIPAEFMDRLTEMGGCTGYPEMETGRDYDAVCTAIDTELYKILAFRMLKEAGVFIAVNTMLAGAIMKDAHIQGVITESRSGREAVMANSFVDATGYGDLCAHAGAEFTVPNDYDSCNSFGFANASIDDYYQFLKSNDALGQICRGPRSGSTNKFVRMGAESLNIPGFVDEANKIGLSMITTTVHDNYLMYIKCNYKIPGTIINRDDLAEAEVEIRNRMAKGAELFKKYVPGFEKAFIARTSPSLVIRRGRQIICDYDITHEDVIDGRHFDDDAFVYGFHDSAPHYQIKDGGTYGIPYRALCVKGVENLYAIGMMITSDRRAHMSTRNTVSCMGQGQAAGTAAALSAQKKVGSRDLKYGDLRAQLEKGKVYFER